MKDLYLEDYDTYLNSLERFAAPKREHANLLSKGRASNSGIRATAIICVVVAVGTIVPWIG
ncbi:MAG: hypothetical protein ACR2O1_02945 [Boseongicola sp.]